VRKGPIEAGGEVLDVDSNDAGPTTADWDGDGRWDLIVGGGAGTVMFFRNEGSVTAPKLAAGIKLLEGAGHQSRKHDETPTRVATRAKPHVCDWNGDGTLDLLVGDFASVQGPEPQLTDEQKVQREELEASQQELNTKLGALYQKCDMDMDKLTGDDKQEYEALTKQNQEIWTKLRPLQPEHRTAGHVWVYLQRPAANAGSGKGTTKATTGGKQPKK
jgi:hypothetical protein